MDTPNSGDSTVSDTALIKAVLPRHSPKLLSRLMGVPIETARHWIYKRLSNTRRRDLARALLEEMDRQDVERSALRYRLAQWAAEVNGGTENAAASLGGLPDRKTRAKAGK